MQKTTFGHSIESLVCEFLEQQGLECVQKNFYCRLGEVDLILHESTSNTLVFVEVRFRTNAFHGNPTETVDWKKQRKLKRTVLYYLQQIGDARQAARIDVVGVTGAPGNSGRAAVGRQHTVDDSATQIQRLSLNNVSVHLFQQYQLVWTRNAITE